MMQSPFSTNVESEDSRLHSEVPPVPATDATGAGHPDVVVAPPLPDTAEHAAHVHSPIQATDNRVDERTPLVASFTSGGILYRNKFKGICTKVICTMKTAIILIEILLFAMFLGLFFVLAFYHDSHLKQSGYPGDTILLVEGLEPFWYQGIVVKVGGSTQTEWEVSLFKEKCTDLKSYYTESHVESRNLTSNGEPVRILEHRSNLNNYFTSGNISVTVLISSTTRVEMDLCIFDNLQWYQDFYENPTKEAKQKSWKPCMHNYTDVQPTTLMVSYLIDSPSYYFIAVAPTKPVSFSLQYTLQLQQEVYNHSDYEPLNCTVTSTSFCSVPLTGEYALGSGDEWCILAFDPVLPSDDEDYIPLQVHLKSRALNTFSICVLGVLLIFVIIACTESGICLYVKIKQISHCK